MVTNDLVIRTLNGFAEQEQAEQWQPAIGEQLEDEGEAIVPEDPKVSGTTPEDEEQD